VCRQGCLGQLSHDRVFAAAALASPRSPPPAVWSGVQIRKRLFVTHPKFGDGLRHVQLVTHTSPSGPMDVGSVTDVAEVWVRPGTGRDWHVGWQV
jgi:hypothetical protein